MDNELPKALCRLVTRGDDNSDDSSIVSPGAVDQNHRCRLPATLTDTSWVYSSATEPRNGSGNHVASFKFTSRPSLPDSRGSSMPGLGSAGASGAQNSS